MIIVFVLTTVGGAYVYVKKIQNDLRVSQENNAKLELATQEQQKLIEQQIEDNKAIVTSMNELKDTNDVLQNSIKDLNDKFHKVNASGEKRDIGALATQKPNLVERVINTAGKNALRCVEIASGSPLTDKEKNATRKSQYNPECSYIANPNNPDFIDVLPRVNQ
tara:strand:- start:505 stop:996 length:492 start_codon:yes stop_codon:yes gene_type:complete